MEVKNQGQRAIMQYPIHAHGVLVIEIAKKTHLSSAFVLFFGDFVSFLSRTLLSPIVVNAGASEPGTLCVR